MRVEENHLSSPHSLSEIAGGNDIARNGALAHQEVVDVVCVFVGRDKFRHRLAVFRDHYGFPLSLNFNPLQRGNVS